MTDKGFSDEAIILKVKNWQTADKYAVCFSRAHGKVTFLAYGARRYARTNGGRLIQPFAVLDINFFGGKKLDTLKSCELISYPAQFNLQQMAYAGLIAEVTEHLSEEHQQQEEADCRGDGAFKRGASAAGGSVRAAFGNARSADAA